MIKNNAIIRIVLADDHLLFRASFKRIIESQQYKPDIKIIAEASNGLELIESVRLHQPHIAITDIKMPEMDGIEATKTIKDQFPATHVIALSEKEDADTVTMMVEAGVSGYLVKSSTYEEIIEAINKVYNGKAYFCGAVSDKIYRNFTVDKTKPKQYTSKPVQFSPKEKVIIKLICRQLTSQEIAVQLKLPLFTIEDYYTRIQKKMGARNAVGIAVYALTNEIIRAEDL